MMKKKLSFYALVYTIVSDCGMPKVGVVESLRMHTVHNFVKFPPPLLALHPPLIKILSHFNREKVYNYLNWLGTCQVHCMSKKIITKYLL